jgi:hypothetical protein
MTWPSWMFLMKHGCLRGHQLDEPEIVLSNARREEVMSK